MDPTIHSPASLSFFRRLYNRVLSWSKHPHARYYLAGVSFAEASVFPIPPDVMLIPMILSAPTKVWKFAWIATLSSILGGLLGYALGYFAFEAGGEYLIRTFHYEEAYAQVSRWFEHYGFWAVLLAGFTPVPYKLFTLGAGAAQMALLPFFLASLVGRGLRFFLVAALTWKLGLKLEPYIAKYVDRIAWILLGLVACIILLSVAGCSVFSVQEAAPVVSIDQYNQYARANLAHHTVVKGEGLYAIAWRYGIDYRDLALRNKIVPPYVIYPGQRLHLKTKAKAITLRGEKAKASINNKTTLSVLENNVANNLASSDWVWPAQGKVIKHYHAPTGSKGVDISGKLGEKIYAAATGKVVYSGAGLRGYGQLVIIKHNETYLSAYAHNTQLLVAENDWVAAGQEIATMGMTGTDTVKLHFEIRKDGQPVDPLTLLPEK